MFILIYELRNKKTKENAYVNCWIDFIEINGAKVLEKHYLPEEAGILLN